MWLRKSSFTFELTLAAPPLNALVCFFLCLLLVCHNSSFRTLMSSADWSCAYFCFLLHVIELETFPSIGRVRVQHRGILLTLKGIVIRSGAAKMHEGERMYRCHTCKNRCVRPSFPFFLPPFVICTERISSINYPWWGFSVRILLECCRYEPYYNIVQVFWHTILQNSIANYSFLFCYYWLLSHIFLCACFCFLCPSYYYRWKSEIFPYWSASGEPWLWEPFDHY